MDIDFIDPVSLRAASTAAETERKRLFGWWKQDFKGTKYSALYLHRCRRLAKIRDQFELLATTYES
jgi:hypothetical protein